MNWTETDILAKGRVPDGAGGYRLPGKAEDFDNGCGESGPVQLSTYDPPAVNTDQRVIDVGTAGRKGGSRSSDRPVVNSRPQIRVPRRRAPNKTEARWLISAKARWPTLTILYEPLIFRLPSGCRYTPDFVAFHGPTIAWAAECKSEHIHSPRSVHAWKEAAAAFPSWPWIFAQRRGGEWCETQINPVT